MTTNNELPPCKECGMMPLAKTSFCLHPASDCQFGAIIAVADLYACLHISHFQMGGYLRAIPAQIPFARGPYCWLLRKVVRVKPFPVRGQQGLFDCPFTLQYLPTNPGAPGNNPTKLRRVLKEMIR